MTDFSNSLTRAMTAAASGMETQSFRMRLSSENLSNVDTPGFQRKLAVFGADMDGVLVKRVFLDRAEGKTLHDPFHPLADGNGIVELSNVDMMIEMADARQASRSYQANIEAFTRAQTMYDSLINILKR